MTKILKIAIILFVTTFMLPGPSFAQIKIQVVTRTISKIFTYKPGNTFEIKAEKASIRVINSPDNTIKVKLQLISKNPSKQTAETDLKYCNYQITESKDLIMISNFFDSKDQFKEISSNLNARYEIEIPSGIILKIKNIYGNIDMTEVKGNFNISTDFGQVKLADIRGVLNINANYSDIKGQNIGTNSIILAQKADIILTDISGILKIKNQYGSVVLEDIKSPVDVDAEMTEVTIKISTPGDYTFNFFTSDGEINLPIEYRKMITFKNKDLTFILSNGNKSIKVKTTYNSITLKTK